MVLWQCVITDWHTFNTFRNDQKWFLYAMLQRRKCIKSCREIIYSYDDSSIRLSVMVQLELMCFAWLGTSSTLECPLACTVRLDGIFLTTLTWQVVLKLWPSKVIPSMHLKVTTAWRVVREPSNHPFGKYPARESRSFDDHLNIFLCFIKIRLEKGSGGGTTDRALTY